MNWYKKAQSQYYYALNCTDLEEGMPIQEMINKEEKVSWEEFNEHVSNAEIRNIFGNIYDYDDKDSGTGLKFQDDYTISFYKSFFEGTPCYYLDHSGIEYIFLSGQGVYD